MKIAVFGASGTIGQRIVREALDRGHEVTAISRHPLPSPFNGQVKAVAGDVTDPGSVARAVAGHDVVVSAVGPGHDQAPEFLSQAARGLLDGLPRAGVRRLIVVNGAGSLEVAPGKQLVDTPEFHEAWKPTALAHRDALQIYRRADLDWTVFSPAALITPGERTGKYRTGTDQLVTDEQGQSRISAEDYAVALLDEVEQPRHIRQRFTVAY
jgi:putative NADH-flavin reductase